VTPLLGADGEVYAVSQGTVQVSGFSAQGNATSVTKGVPTSGRIPNGAIVEREVPFNMAGMKRVKLALRNPDCHTARPVARPTHAFVGLPAAEVADPTTVVVDVPANYKGQTIEMLTDIEQRKIEPDQVAKVVIDEQSGTIVMGENVRISTVAIAQGN